MLFWLDPSTMPAIPNGSKVQYWLDKSGNNRNALQLGGLLQPTLSTNKLNGYPALKFEPSDFMDISNIGLTGNDDFTIVVVVSGTTGSPIFDTNTVDGGGIKLTTDSGGTITFYDNGYNTYSNIGEFSNGWNVIFISHLDQNPYGDYLFCDAFHTSEETGITSSFLPANYTLHIGQLVGTPNTFLNGHFVEMVGYSKQVSTDERNNLISFYHTKYNI